MNSSSSNTGNTGNTELGNLRHILLIWLTDHEFDIQYASSNAGYTHIYVYSDNHAKSFLLWVNGLMVKIHPSWVSGHAEASATLHAASPSFFDDLEKALNG